MRGPMVGKVVGQMLSGTEWGELDYLLVDLPPGTGDVQLTLCQTYGLSAALVITTPQRLARVDVEKGIDMFRELGVPIAGLIENIAFFTDGEAAEGGAGGGGGGGGDAEAAEGGAGGGGGGGGMALPTRVAQGSTPSGEASRRRSSTGRAAARARLPWRSSSGSPPRLRVGQRGPPCDAECTSAAYGRLEIRNVRGPGPKSRFAGFGDLAECIYRVRLPCREHLTEICGCVWPGGPFERNVRRRKHALF